MATAACRSSLRLLALITAVVVLSACRVVVIVPPVGGEVHTQDEYALDAPRPFCDSGEECTRTVTVAGFIDTFVAVPHAGWKFAGWSTGWRHMCGRTATGILTGGLQSTVCTLDISSFSGNPEVQAMVADDDQVYYVSPIFVPEDSAVAITDTIIAGGREWAQPADFLGLSWDGIMGVCPGGACGPGAILRGYDMEGWTFASLDDVNALANHYLAGEYTMGPGPDEYTDAASALTNVLTLTTYSPFGYLYWANGPFRETPFAPAIIETVVPMIGLTASTDSADPASAGTGRFSLTLGRDLILHGRVSTLNTVTKDNNDLTVGAFFYRLP